MNKKNHSRFNEEAEGKNTAPDAAAAIENDAAETFDDLGEAAEESAETEAEDSCNELTAVEQLTAQLEEEKAKVEKEKKEYMFLMAEFDNFRKRTIREKGEIIRNASEKVLSGLLPIVDDFERGIEANRNSSDADAVKEGMELIYNKLVRYLEQNGVKAIESNGTEFNSDIHEAIAMVPVDDEALKGKVIDTPVKGYMINDKVLRHAKVAVGQ